MPDREQPQGRYYGASAEHRAQIRAAFRVAAKAQQQLVTAARGVEESLEIFRDRSTLPTPESVRNRIGGRWQYMWNQLKAAEKTLTDLFGLFY
jgi:hypothetical protein